MARKPRYFSDDDSDVGVTPSELKRMGRARQKEYVRHWFHRNFEDPAQETPFNSQEGGYLFIWGGPYDAHEQLFDEFGSIIAEERIEEIANEIINDDGIHDWAPGGDHPNTRQREEEWRAEHGESEENDNSFQVETLEKIIEHLETGMKPSYGDGYEVDQRRKIQDRLDQLRLSLTKTTPPHGGIGHNQPPPDDDSPQVIVIVEIRDAEKSIRTELAKPQPNALEVAKATSRLRSALGWLGKKIDTAANSFAQGFGKTLGATAAVAVVAGAALLVPSLMQLLTEIIQRVTEWLSYITLPF